MLIVVIGLVAVAAPFAVSAVQNIFIDSQQIVDIQVGGDKINQVYVGSTLVWERQQAPTGTDIQLIGSGKIYLCPTTRTRVRDARDGATYWIRKIPNTKGGGGDLCWMETNLAYAGGGTNTYGDAMSAITRGMVESYTAAYYDIPPGANRTAGTTNPSVSTNGTGQYGYLYNWCAAMGRQSAACQDSAIVQPIQSENPGNNIIYNVCPAGWRLPTGGTGGEFASLNVAINGGSATSPSGLLANGLFMYSGSWEEGAFGGNIGTYGYNWSSTPNSSIPFHAHDFRFFTAGVTPLTSFRKTSGYAVRCVAD